MYSEAFDNGFMKTKKNKIPIKWSASKQQLYVVTKYTFVFIAAGFIAVS